MYFTAIIKKMCILQKWYHVVYFTIIIKPCCVFTIIIPCCTFYNNNTMLWILYWFDNNNSDGGFPGGTSGKEPACQCRSHRSRGFDGWVGKIPWSRKWQPTPVFLPGESYGQRSLVGYSPKGCKKLDLTEQLSTHRVIVIAIKELFSQDQRNYGAWLLLLKLLWTWEPAIGVPRWQSQLAQPIIPQPASGLPIPFPK